jgi:anti-sigma B factor antagonist
VENLFLDVRSNGSGDVVAGEVDMATAPQLDACLCDHADSNVVVDLSAVTFLDSAGISALVHARNLIQTAGHTLRVTGEQDNVKAVLKVAGLHDIFHRDQ